MYLLRLLCLFSCLPLLSVGQKGCRVVFYNVENLFDTSDDPLTGDDEFTPFGAKHWTRAHYADKLLRLAEVLDSLGGKELPVFIGLAEVENRRVLEELTRKTLLVDGDYAIVHQDSPDSRGIDVAFLYRPGYFRLLTTDFLRLSFPEDSTLKTRDILYASGLLGMDTLHFFVCHFPSMLGGEKQSEWKRIRAAAMLRSRVDSLLMRNPRAEIIIMGDLNGRANTRAQKTLRTHPSDQGADAGELYNTGYYLLNKVYGSYRYQGRWQTIDHIIVSGSLLDGLSSWKAVRHLSIYSAPFLLEDDKSHFGFRPLSTYHGPRYIGGYSDHLPVYLDVYPVPPR